MRKKYAQTLLHIICLAILLAACQQNPKQVESPSLPEPNQTFEETSQWITVSDVNLKGMTLYWQHDNLQFVSDENAVISAYVTAEKNDDGSFSFDDAQEWVVIMKTSLGHYSLFPRQRVQLGNISCVVFNEYVDYATISHVLIIVQQTAGYRIYDCIFDTDKEAFLIEPVYDAEDINFILDTKN